MEEFIEEIQNKFNKNLSSKNLNYDNVIIPLCEELLKAIGKNPSTWPIILNTKNIIDIYYETIYYFYVINIHDKIIKNIPIQLMIELMSYKPLIYFINLMSRTYEEIENYKKELLNSITDTYGKNNYNKRISDLIELINLESINYEKLSAISYFHYFIGFEFEAENIGVKNIPNDKGYIIVNITYNMKYNEESTYVFRKSKERIGLKFLTEDVMEKFKPIEKIKTHNPKKLIEKTNIKEENYIIFKYNNENFTVAKNILNENEAKRFIKGAIPIFITTEDFISYSSNLYYNNLQYLISINNLNDNIKLPKYNKIYYEVISPIYEYYSDAKHFNYIKFVEKIIKHLNKDYINEKEIPLLTFYLLNYNYTDDFNFIDFLAYLKEFIEPT